MAAGKGAIGTENPAGNRLAMGDGLYDRHDLHQKARRVYLDMGFDLLLPPLDRN
jgi:hypothetical protein